MGLLKSTLRLKDGILKLKSEFDADCGRWFDDSGSKWELQGICLVSLDICSWVLCNIEAK